MGCQTAIADKIIEKKADYILVVKDNQKSLKLQIIKLFEQSKQLKIDESIDTGYGRVETRICEVIDNIESLEGKERWKSLNSIVKITSKRYIKTTKKESFETQYYISSLKLMPKE